MANIRTKKCESTTQEHTRSMCKIGNWKFIIAHITDAIYRMQMSATLVERTTFRQRKTSAEGSFGFGRIEALLRKRCKAQAFHGLPLTLGSARGTSVSRLKWTHWGRHVAPGTWNDHIKMLGKWNNPSVEGLIWANILHPSFKSMWNHPNWVKYGIFT